MKKLKELVICNKYTANEIARIMMVQYTTIVKHSHKLGLGEYIDSKMTLRLVRCGTW